MSNEMSFSLLGDRKVTAHYDGHVICTGGEAPGPFDFFLASLGTCTGYYITRYCETRELDPTGITIHQRWHRNEKGVVTDIELSINVPESFSARHRKGILRAGGTCSVKKLLISPPNVTCSLVSEPAVEANVLAEIARKPTNQVSSASL